MNAIVDAKIKSAMAMAGKNKHASERIRPGSRQAFDSIEKLTEDEVNYAGKNGIFDNRNDITRTIAADKRGGNPDLPETLKTLNIDMWSLLSAKAEGEGEETLESCSQGE